MYIHVDGTNQKTHAILVSTDTGTYGIGLSETQTETASLLNEPIGAIQEMTCIDIANNENKLNEIMLKVKNTMTDRCVVNKKFVQLMQEWQEKKIAKSKSFSLCLIR